MIPIYATVVRKNSIYSTLYAVTYVELKKIDNMLIWTNSYFPDCFTHDEETYFFKHEAKYLAISKAKELAEKLSIPYIGYRKKIKLGVSHSSLGLHSFEYRKGDLRENSWNCS